MYSKTPMTKAGRIRILLATTNQGKIQQYKDVLAKSGLMKHIRLYTLKSTKFLRSIQPIEETDTHYTYIATKKAYLYGKKANMIAISDDSGIEVYALDRKPGIHSHEESPNSILEKMTKESNRNATMFTTCSIYDPINNRGAFFDNLLHGSIIEQPELLCNKPYGYDGIFAPKNLKCSVEYALENKFDTREGMHYPRTVGLCQVATQIKQWFNITD